MFTNIADTVGFKVSMDAYQMRVQENGYEQTLEFYPEDSDQQLFTRAFANVIYWMVFEFGSVAENQSDTILNLALYKDLDCF